MSNAIKNSEINVERRAIYTPGGRGKRVMYEARGTLRGVDYSVGAPTKAEAIALINIDSEPPQAVLDTLLKNKGMLFVRKIVF